MLANGKTNKEMAAELNYSISAIKRIVQILMGKLGAQSRAHMIAVAIKSGTLPIGLVE